MPGCTALLGDERCATVCTQPSIQKIFKIMLYQFRKNTTSNQPVVLGQPQPLNPPGQKLHDRKRETKVGRKGKHKQ